MQFGGLRCPAKVNLNLHILERSGDHHLLQSVLLPVSLFDTLRVRILGGGSNSEGFDCSAGCYFLNDDLKPKDNTVVKAIKALIGFGIRDVEVILRKGIPVGSGLGGGSSDAAGALHLLDRMFGLRRDHVISNEDLFDIALSIGSDVPFFLDYLQYREESSRPYLALVEGFGERVKRLEGSRKRMLLITSNLNFLTRDIFASEMKSFSDRLSLDDLLHSNRNDLFSAALAHDLRFNRLVNELSELLMSFSVDLRMSGSGSTLFVMLDDFGRREVWGIKRCLRERFKRLREELGIDLELMESYSL